MTKMNRRVIIACLAVLIVAGVGVAWWTLSRSDVSGVSSDGSGDEPSPTALIAEATPARTASAARIPHKAEAEREASEPDEPVVDAWVEDLPEEWQALGQRIVDAIDKEDMPALKKLVPEALRCPNAGVRQKMVEGLDWYGRDAIIELTKFLADKDKDVADAAFNAWDTAVDEIEDEPFKIEVAAGVMMALTDKDNLSSVATKLEAADDRKAALLALVDVAESSNKAALDAVKESYEFIAGEEWTDVAAARAKAEELGREDEEE